MVEFVSVDASKAEQGNRSFLVGVALEVSNGTKFDRQYFDLVDGFCEKYGIELGHNILKSSDVLNRMAAYNIREGTDALVKGLIENSALRRIHVAIGWYDVDEVQLSFNEDSIRGIEFANDHLAQYFPIVTLWRYHQNHRTYGNIPSEAWIDNVQGKITKAWKYVGNEFDVNLVPHGDNTYPSLSAADIIANHLARTLPPDVPLGDLEDHAAGMLIEHSTEDCYVAAESVNQEYGGHIVPQFPYSIQGELHFPHPVLFIHDEMFQDINQDVLPETDFHAFARKWAQQHAGCVVNLEPHRLPAIVKSGDVMVHTAESPPDMCRQLQRLNPSRDISIMGSDELMDEMMEE